MALSMTGFGRRSKSTERWEVEVEARSLNNRYLKVRTHCSPVVVALDGDIEVVVRKRLSRGAVDIWVKVTDVAPAQAYGVDMELARRYSEFASALGGELGIEGKPGVADYMALPGVVSTGGDKAETLEELRPLVMGLLEETLSDLEEMRRQEGGTLAEDIRKRSGIIGALAKEISNLAPGVVQRYRDRLLARVRQLVDGSGVEIAEESVLREISIFAERSDISEELARIESHIEQLDETLGGGEIGRKLEFVAQELQREVNTIGSKANDAAISRLVVDAKGEIDKIREQSANLE